MTRALIVDDESINLMVSRGYLERLGITCEVAKSGKEALEAMEKETFSIVFMDIQMPEMDGKEATAIMRERLGENCPPVVAVTAGVHNLEKLALIFDEVLPKPLKFDVLRETLNRILG